MSLIKHYNYLKIILLKLFNKSKFSDIYLNEVVHRLTHNKVHPTLGINIRENGLGLFKTILNEFKINKTSVVLDYGCGSLRVGQHFIKYLNKSNYIGLDISEHFYNLGKRRIDKVLLEEKKPYLDIISNKSINFFKTKKINVIFSTGVLMHIPPNELTEYFDNIFSLGNAKTNCFITFLESDESFRINKLTFIYTSDYLAKIIKKYGCSLSFKRLRKHLKHSNTTKKNIWITRVCFSSKD